MAEQIKRITPEEVVEAYRKTGLGITRDGEYISQDMNCSCGMGAYAIAYLGVKLECAVIDDIWHEIDRRLDDAGFTKLYQNGFAAGFDGDRYSREEIERWAVDWRIGYADGQAAYAAAKEAARV